MKFLKFSTKILLFLYLSLITMSYSLGIESRKHKVGKTSKTQFFFLDYFFEMLPINAATGVAR